MYGILSSFFSNLLERVYANNRIKSRQTPMGNNGNGVKVNEIKSHLHRVIKRLIINWRWVLSRMDFANGENFLYNGGNKISIRVSSVGELATWMVWTTESIIERY